jgi:hypothetical protein
MLHVAQCSAVSWGLTLRAARCIVFIDKVFRKMKRFESSGLLRPLDPNPFERPVPVAPQCNTMRTTRSVQRRIRFRLRPACNPTIRFELLRAHIAPFRLSLLR